MLLCRIISIFFLLVPSSFLAKNVSLHIDDSNTEHLKSEDFDQITKDHTSQSRLSEAECTLEGSSETYEDSNASLSDDPLLEDEKYGYVIEKFINEMEGFWQEIKLYLLEQKSDVITSGKWWHEGPENKYKTMKDKFYKDIPDDLPQKIINIISEYEMRYNDLMWSEIENLINEANDDDYICDSGPIYKTQSEIKDQEDKEQNVDLRGSLNNGKCRQRKFEDLFEVKITKVKSLSPPNCDE